MKNINGFFLSVNNKIVKDKFRFIGLTMAREAA
jgi:hypothetical protein